MLDPADVQFASEAIGALRQVTGRRDLTALMEAFTKEMGFRHYALIHHADLRVAREEQVNLRAYPAIISERLIDQGLLRRDPVVRACAFAGGAFLWSDLPNIIELGRADRQNLAFGHREGLNQGVTVPYIRLGDCLGSCTFAGTAKPELSETYLGVAQMIGVFAFQTALRLSGAAPRAAPLPRLQPRPRECVVLAGCGLSNKEIARSLSLTPRTVDGYLTEARRLFGAQDRTELVVSAVLAGEVGLHELRRRQPEHLLGL